MDYTTSAMGVSIHHIPYRGDLTEFTTADWNLDEYRADWEALHSFLPLGDRKSLTLEEYARRMRMAAVHIDHDAPKLPGLDGPDLSSLAHSPPSEDSTVAFSREEIAEFMRTRAMEDQMDALMAHVESLYVSLCRVANCNAGNCSGICGKSPSGPDPDPESNPDPGSEPNPGE